MTAPEECQFIVDELDQNLLNYALENTNETNKSDCLPELRSLILERGECSQHTFEDVILIRFLRARNFVIRHAHRLLVNYCKFKRTHAEYYGQIKLKDVEESAKFLTVQPICETNNRRIFIFKFGKWNPNKLTFKQLVQQTILILELFILEARTQILGGICIVDLDGIKKRHLKFITLKFITQMLDILLWSFPLRIHAVHIVNNTSATDFDFSIVKLFMNEEAKRRIISHGSDLKSLHNHISSKYLPEEYGGCQPGFSYGSWLTGLVKNNSTIVQELQRIDYTFVE